MYNYVYDYSILSLVFLLIVIVCFFYKRQFPSRRNKLFGIALVCAFFDILLDMLGSMTIERALTAPSWLVMSVNSVFYLLQTVFPALMFEYIAAIIGSYRKREWRWMRHLFIPAAATALSIVINPFTRILFYIDPAVGYVHAPLFLILYVNSAFYIIASLALLIYSRNRIKRLEYVSIFIFLLVTTLAVGIQFLFPSYLLTGAAIAVAITVMYLVMQKPEDMLDVMTDVFNRSAMTVFLQDRITDGEDYQVIALELNNLNRINRLFGMAFGNRVLSDLARSLTMYAPSCWVFRSLGNAFALITRDASEHELAYSRISERFKTPFEVGGVQIELTATMFAIKDTSSVASSEEMIELMELILPDIPSGGRRVVDKQALEALNRRVTVEAALIKAVESEALDVYYQPIYSVGERQCVTAEALLRFKHPTMGFISPSEFIPIAEKNDLVLKIDTLVLKRVCALIRAGLPSGFRSIEINLSAVEFVNENLASRVTSIVDEYGVDPKRIIFEITETAATADFSVLMGNMESLCKRGFRFVLDDYGTGYANVAQILRLPLYAVKIDRSMLLMYASGERDALVFDRTLRMLAALGFYTVVEGVETREQAEFSRACGADYLQGYLYHRPMPEDDFKKLVAVPEAAG